MIESKKARAARNRRLLLQYGISADDYDAVLHWQGGVCYICQAPPKNVRLAADHHHRTGLFRGLVCWTCNRAIAYLRDNRERALRASEYLSEFPPSFRALGCLVYGRVGRSSRKWTKKERRERLATVADRL